jgi:MoaA/NifB/PqqE/SkfB family radical SAM enzyme
LRQLRYRDFSLKAHNINLSSHTPSACQFELTFRCGLRCRHCYTNCYDRASCQKKELAKDKIEVILDKISRAGALWLCFTGGDPLTRPDFKEIYSYAKAKGFLVTIFTNGYSMTKDIIALFKEQPPFCIEVTLNAVTKKRYEMISQAKGSFFRAMRGIELILRAKLPLKIKTQVTKDNWEELPEIKRFLKEAGLKFYPSYILYPRLDGDKFPCSLRINPKQVLELEHSSDCDKEFDGRLKLDNFIFPCVVGSGDGFNIDPFGNIYLCRLIRKPAINLHKVDIAWAMRKILPFFRNKKFKRGSECGCCRLRGNCWVCPGKSYLESGNLEGKIGYYCELSRLNTLV